MTWKELENKVLNILLDFERDVYYNDNDSKLSDLKDLIMKEFERFCKNSCGFYDEYNKRIDK